MNVTICCEEMHECIRNKIIQVSGDGVVLDCKKGYRRELDLNFCPFCGAQITFSSPKGEEYDSPDIYPEHGW